MKKQKIKEKKGKLDKTLSKEEPHEVPEVKADHDGASLKPLIKVRMKNMTMNSSYMAFH